MSKRKRSRGKKPPSYRHHKASGQAVVWIDGKDVYLGEYGSEESHERYRRILAERSEVRSAVRIIEPTSQSEITIRELTIAYKKHADQWYRKNGKPTTEAATVQIVLKRLNSIYGSTPASEFGSVRYQAYRQTYIDEGLTRKTINSYMFHVREIFNLAAKSERTPWEWYWRLKGIGNLIAGRSAAKETDDILPVDDHIVDATIKHLTPTLASMVEVQRLTGMRPGEVVQIRPCDIDRSGDVWLFKPPRHKNQHLKSRRAKSRVIAIGPIAQKILTPFLLRDHMAFCFSPSESYAQRHGENSKRSFAPCYDANSYRKAVQRAALRAFPFQGGKPNRENIEAWDRWLEWCSRYCWSPNQLRHSAATKARKEADLETAQQVCGHTQKRTTESNYAEIDRSLAVDFARKFG